MIESRAIDSLISGFEQEWSALGTPSIRDYLARSVLDEQKDALLVELICVDMEYRWKRYLQQPSTTKTVEDYISDFSQLGPISNVLLVLIQEEYRARQQWGDSPDHKSFLRRFSDRNGDVPRVLALVDSELHREYPMNRPALKNNEIVEGRSSSSTQSEEQTRLKYQDYMLHEMIGSGQMGRVYRATHTPTNNTVAVKFLRKSFYQDVAAVSRFLKEARTVSRLRHVGIVRVYGVGDTPGGGYFIVMEYLDGPDLAAIIAEGPVEISDAVRWTIQAAEAAGYSNEEGVIHCDLKPGNLVLDKQRNVRVTDFGLARSVLEEFGRVDRIAGTAPYMAPEQVSAWWGEIGPHTDVYALGAVLYSLLTGHAPYQGRTVTDILSCVVSGTQPVPPEVLRTDIDPELAGVVAKALTKAPDLRFHSAKEFVEALNGWSNSAIMP
jgi:hypothetical protein